MRRLCKNLWGGFKLSGYREYFCNRLGVLQGAETSDEKAHAWNMVRLGNGSYYYVDVTYDDGGELGIFDSYLCVGKEIFEDHSMVENGSGNNSYFMYELPACAAEKFTGIDTLVKMADPEFKVSNVEEDYMKDAKGEPCGETLYWELSSDGVMTISGMGKMWDFSIDGVLYTTRETKWENYPEGSTLLIQYPCGKKDKEYTLAEGTAEIQPGAIEDAEYLEEIHIPDTVQCIREGAIGSCPKLKSLTIPSSVQRIIGSVGAYCDNLEYIKNQSEVEISLKGYVFSKYDIHKRYQYWKSVETNKIIKN